MACLLGDLLYVRYFDTWHVDDSGMPTQQLVVASSSPNPHHLIHSLYWCLACDESFPTWEDAKAHLFLTEESESAAD